MKFIGFAVIISISTCIGFCSEDSVEKQRQLIRYFEAVPVQETINNSIEQLAVSLSPAEKDRFMAIMTRYFDLTLFKATIEDAMLRNLTTSEIKALADFYGTKEGKSGQKKLGLAIGESLPIMLKELDRASAAYDHDHNTK